MRKSRARHNNSPALRAQDHSRFTPRAISIVLIILIIFLGWTFFWLLSAERQTLLIARRNSLQEQLQVGLSLCRAYQIRSETGELTRDRAIAETTQILRGLRYGAQSQGYFYVIDTQGKLVLHPFRRDLEGTDIYNLKDGRGEPFIQRLIALADRQPGMFSTYRFRWLDGSTAVPDQLACAAVFEPWNWVVVTDAATTDIDEQIMAALSRQVAVLVMLVVVLAAVIAVTLRRVVLQGIDRLIDASRRLASGDFTARAVISPTDELSDLATALNQMASGLQAREEQVRIAQRAAVFALAKLAEARDNETGGHLLRVREYVTTLAHGLRRLPAWRELITRQFLADIYDASLLHDIGKVALPDHVLLKPDTLDDAEVAIMMSHTLIGANTIRAARKLMKAESSFLVLAEQIARSHHERWDGKGYVEGLAGEAIPLAARIFAVADVYDALTTVRPYKPAYSHQQALEMMNEERGTRFDPSIFDVFLSLSAEFDTVRHQFID